MYRLTNVGSIENRNDSNYTFSELLDGVDLLEGWRKTDSVNRGG